MLNHGLDTQIGEGNVTPEESKNLLRELLLKGSSEELNHELEHIHPADILEILHEDDDANFETILKRLPESFVADLIDEEDEEEKYEILKVLSDYQQSEVLKEMSSDELTDLVGSLEDEELDDVLNKMSDEDREDVKQLLAYDPDTAGGIMATEFIAIWENKTVKKTLEYLQSIKEEMESSYYLFVTDRNFILKGVISLRELVSKPFDTLISEITNPHVISIDVNMDQEEVAHKFEKYGFVTMPVVDETNKMLGIVTVDDIVQIIQDENTEDIHQLGGVSGEERVDGTLAESIRSRLPWLMVNLLTAILAASVVGAFEGTISQVVALATIMPIVTGMGGNAGTQSLTIIVRGIALGELTGDNARRILFKELGVGLITGVVIGLLMCIIGLIFQGKMIFGLVCGVAMFLNMVAATMAGYFVPLLLKKMHVDPALASAVFVTTVTDVLGFFFFLGLATMFLPYLL